MSDTATLQLPGQESVELPVITGSEGEKAIDVSKLRAKTGYITHDPGYVNTGSCSSSVTFLDGEKGILRYRGYPIEQLAENSSFVEVAYLLLNGALPTVKQLDDFNDHLSKHSLIHEDMKHFFEGFSTTAHPMVILSSMVSSLSAYYSEASGAASVNQLEVNTARLMAKIRTIIKALDLLLILHADHEQNCSASTVRVVGSSMANVYASVASGILALWGPLHGGANQQVLRMLEQIHADGDDLDKYVRLAKDPDSDFRLMGFGHRVYKNFDPRATIIKGACDRVLNLLGVDDPLLDLARRLEEVALSDEYFVERKLYPNVDFYSGIIYRAIGIPENMFTVMFALGRLPGWIAQWKEMHQDPKTVKPHGIMSRSKIGSQGRTQFAWYSQTCASA